MTNTGKLIHQPLRLMVPLKAKNSFRLTTINFILRKSHYESEVFDQVFE
jgi:hypothetical protein